MEGWREGGERRVEKGRVKSRGRRVEEEGGGKKVEGGGGRVQEEEDGEWRVEDVGYMVGLHHKLKPPVTCMCTI